MLISELMTIHPVAIEPEATVRRAAELISLSGLSDLMVTKEDHRFIGVLSEGDILRTMLPDQEEIAANGGTLGDAFHIFLQKGRTLADYPILPLIILDPITMKSTDPVAKAAFTMIKTQIHLLPVVDDGKLVGTVSRRDVVRAVVYRS
ncbi:MAG TPA: CBS domain-containing protein [Anaerolineae bacterium]|nr:CBS domain-containing protein [Anaerolineae bacterium]